MNRTTQSHHHHPDIFFSSNGEKNKSQFEHCYDTSQTKHNMDISLDASIEISSIMSPATTTMMTGLSSSAYESSNGSFDININDKVINGPSTNLLNHSQVTSSTTPTNAKGWISSWNGDSLEGFLFDHVSHRATTNNGSAAKERVPRFPLQTMKNSSHGSQAYNSNNNNNNNDLFHDETNGHVTLMQQQQAPDQNDPISNTCFPVCISIFLLYKKKKYTKVVRIISSKLTKN